MSSASPKDRLLIGEVARLLGTTPKAIRHYEKLGLLDEPGRSESGYRLYTANELLRLDRIKKLQHLGLSLERIRNILGDGESGTELEGVLYTLLDEVEGQIERLERRRADLHRALLKEIADSEASLPEDETYAYALFRDHLGERWSSLDPRMLEQVKQLWSTLDAFEWPQGYGELQEGIARYMADHPEECDRLLALEERLAALAHLPEDSSEVELLAGDYAAFFLESTFFEEDFEQKNVVGGSMGGMETMFSGVALNAMYPAQRRCMESLIERLSRDASR